MSGKDAFTTEEVAGLKSSDKITLVRARGSLVWDDTGKEYIDCTAQAWSNNLGANDPRVVEAAIAQTREMMHIRPNFDSLPRRALVKKLREIAPGNLNQIGFALHGSLAGEMAMKLAVKNRPGAQNLIVLQDGYHGRSLATLGASWPHPNNPFLPIQPRFTRVPHPYPYRSRLGMDPEMESQLCLGLLEDAIVKGVDGPVAAVMMEPIQGNGGHIEFPRSYYKGVREICDRHGILFILDEVQTGFGRMGTMWASEYYDVLPDIIVFGKGVGGGFPLAGILADDRLTWFDEGEDALTFGHFPVSLAAGVATIEAIQADNLCAKAKESGEYATQRLLEMQKRHKLIGEVRCPGLMVSFELVTDREKKTPARHESQEVYRLGVERGVLFGESRYAGLGNLIKIKPPLDIERPLLARALDVLDEVLGIIEENVK
ncbi:aminotransferase class III-fold pyridoxal phosphate-dependent enzyme [Paraburkholderia megapolitana]|uniref:alanine--glyoxylate transaminase n=1 Tax=Paraburkholderia megapolitana TaxID=420953 RepID=A0A1I3N8I8_9BURK|nr:aminotransferase class III-fold pyridoxal phosphate-dependent enzyme [Paraburkholderia megapolitana]QDQ84273.1 aminotransferase class III-fold pyridoxal phosphate-dependent enzyme [Paraburkholderia megapolitana]SFJ05136.1 4-aminobutyrate aminotransferase/4-aminobutyrate aminotransferase / (S)-3-amino-2-methylpropionate transaminase [Paraburkholderia megapolitana]